MKILLSINDTILAGGLNSDRIVKEFGYDGFEYAMPSRLGMLQEKRRLHVPELSNVQVVHAPKDIYDAQRFKSALEDAVTVAKNLDATAVNIHPASSHESCGGSDNILGAIKLIKAMEIELGIDVFYEVLARDANEMEKAYLRPGGWLMHILQCGLKATLDTTHIASYDMDPVEFIQPLGKCLNHIHLSDYDSRMKRQHLVPGEGELDLKSFLQVLMKKKPTMTIALEPSKRMYGDNYADAAHRSIRYVKDVIS